MLVTHTGLCVAKLLYRAMGHPKTIWWPSFHIEAFSWVLSKMERMHDMVIGLFINRYVFGVSVCSKINRSETPSYEE
jgi:hypothetical protein